MKTAKPLTKSLVASLAQQAAEAVDSKEEITTYSDLYPAIEPIIKQGGRTAIIDAATFLIDQGVFTEDQRVAVELGIRRERARRKTV